MTLLPVAAATLRRRWTGFAGAFVALTLGVALISAVGALVINVPDNTDPQGPSLAKILQFMAGMGGFVAIFVVAGTFAFAVAQRRRETALLRAIGATPRQVRLLILAESLVIGLLSAVAGCLLGLIMAPAMAAWLMAQGLAPDGFAPSTSLAPLLLAALAGVAVALAGSFAASRRASGVRPAEALGDAVVDRKVMTRGRWLWFLFFLVAAVSAVYSRMSVPDYMLLDPGMRGPDAMATFSLELDLLAIVGFTLLTPLLIPLLVRLFTLPLPVLPGAAILLARQNALAAVRRTVSTATPVFLVIGLSGSVVGGTLAFTAARDAQSHTPSTARYVIEPADDPALSDSVMRALRDLPGIRATAVVSTSINGLGSASTPFAALSIDGDPGTAWHLDTVTGSLADLRGRTVAVSSDLARAFRWEVGEQLRTRLPDGTSATLRLAATFKPTFNVPEVLLSYAAVSGHAQPARAYLSAPPGHVPADTIVTPIENWTDPRTATSGHQQTLTLVAILGPALLYALIAIVNTMIMSTGDRLRDFATLQLTGGTRRQVLRMVGAETVVVVATAAVLGLIVTAATQAGTLWLINNSILDGQAPIPFSLPWSTMGVSVVVCLFLALLSSLLPARLALRRRPLELAGVRE
ncbi:ABC transporter permease [Streptosporangium canum]|uniref:ABC transporter permease n=1 Tax=Streptosporangium canum TaxID=324952 RepID=UPI0033A114EA